MIAVSMPSSGDVPAPRAPMKTSELLFDLNCLNQPQAGLELELGDGTRLAITGVQLDPKSDPKAPTFLLSYEVKPRVIAGAAPAQAEEEPLVDLEGLLEELS